MKHFWTYKTLLFFVVGLVGIIVSGLFATRLLPFGSSESDIKKKLGDVPISYHLVANNKLHVISLGNPKQPPILFIHGSPGHWSNFLDVVIQGRLFERYHVLLVDRPGYGKSQNAVAMPSVQQQAAQIAEALTLNHSLKPGIVLGHSYGGPVAGMMALTLPNRFSRLILVAASVDPGLEKKQWYQVLAEWPVIRHLIDPYIRVCNIEIMALKRDLSAMSPLWRQLEVATVVVHGDKDPLVPVENSVFLKARVPKPLLNIHILKGANHFIPWKHPQSILQHIP